MGAPAQPAGGTPAIALVDAADAPEWRSLTKDLGWQVIAAAVPSTTAGPPVASIDTRAQALAAAVQEAIAKSGVDPARVYLAGRNEATAAVFYTISRLPDLWAAGVALGGSPQPAVDSNRLFSANFTNTPVLWAGANPADQALADQLKSAGLNLEYRPAGITSAAILEWLAAHAREDYPAAIDCETNSPSLARCYWIQMTKFDVNERNDVLPSSLVPPKTVAALDLGGFGYKADDPGPGLLITFLPDKYNGPLKTGDRIVSLEGRPIENARHYAETMAKFTEDRQTAVMVQRGKERNRIETRVVAARREAVPTARVRANYIPQEKEIRIVSRTVTDMRVTVPEAWVPGGLNWNGLTIDELKSPGCYLLTIRKELLHAAPCP